MGVRAEYFLLRPFSIEERVRGCAGTHGFQTGTRCSFTKMHEELQLYLCQMSLTNTDCVFFAILSMSKLNLKSSPSPVRHVL